MDWERLLQSADSSFGDKRELVFIIGMPRSGSTLVEQILCAHGRAATRYGCYKVLFGAGLVPFAYDLQNLASQYADVGRILNYWKAVLPG